MIQVIIQAFDLVTNIIAIKTYNVCKTWLILGKLSLYEIEVPIFLMMHRFERGDIIFIK